MKVNIWTNKKPNYPLALQVDQTLKPVNNTSGIKGTPKVPFRVRGAAMSIRRKRRTPLSSVADF